ncbi:glutamine-hydrolyzing GMP synthase [Actinoalloteichus caeruleus]|uniref:GMP synthase [glutamine-hydrolyzing] n=1 Tax=Actinoalloteichus caeruleus DSM 43889 TaxID=1120930 RepID=A0ABT1JDL2_ACTCY|nr:glutamine-hydrolyzing GMP synthase [Actinoalloteichus caeruleus]MCP2329891.1 GMP synthase (glutamine-hydrolyzing) (EC 6.3.5.2) [Actinoalloteichus caeruleus DSM 43889]
MQSGLGAQRSLAYNRPSASVNEAVVVLDFGSQYSLLIARRLRELGVYCELLPADSSKERIAELAPKGIILSGGPQSVYDAGAPGLSEAVRSAGVPVLGICYGAQLIAYHQDGRVEAAERREFGRSTVKVLEDNLLFDGIGESLEVWMSHTDHILEPPPGHRVVARSEGGLIAAMSDGARYWGVQFHPEVAHTPLGRTILENFVRRICGCVEQWSTTSFVDETVEWLRERIGDRRAICALSGGVDSGVAAALAARAVGDQLTCVFVDNGLLRQNEADQCMAVFAEHLDMKVLKVDASQKFLEALDGVTDPEEKRRRIGRCFMEVFEEVAPSLEGADYFIQGTTYPDVIESAGDSGRHSAAATKIKTHHNVGGLPDTMKLELLDPLSFLFKDEVRAAGRVLGLPEQIVDRHPFPGPGLAVRMTGAVTPERLERLRRSDEIFISELRSAGLYQQTAQALVVLTSDKSVGVLGDFRTYEDVVALRAVDTEDWMTADWSRLPYDFLARVSNRIVNEVPGVNRVVYDISSKPPATVEWE